MDKQKITKSDVKIILIGIIIGLCVHLYAFTNKIPNWDDIVATNILGANMPVGRWGLYILEKVFRFWSMPWLNGLFSIVFFSIYLYILLRLFDIKDIKIVIMSEVMFFTFPCLAGLYQYMFMAPVYSLAYLLSIIGVYFLLKRENIQRYISCVICICCSLSIYQAVLCNILAIIALYFIIKMIEDATVRELFRKGVFCCIAIAVGVFMYWFMLQIMIKYSGIGLGDYQGVSSMGKMDLKQLPVYVWNAISSICRFFILEPFIHSTVESKILEIVVGFMILLGIFFIAYKNKRYIKIENIIMLIFLTLCFFIGTGFIYVMAPDGHMHPVMFVQFWLYYFFAIVLLNELKIQSDIVILFKKVCVFSLIIIGFINAYKINLCYFQANLSYEQAYAWTNRLITRIEMVGRVDGNTKLYISGNIEGAEEFFESGLKQDIGEFLERNVPETKALLSSYCRYSFLRYYFGKNFVQFEDSGINQTAEYINMPVYPEQGSIQYINDVLVVKLSQK